MIIQKATLVVPHNFLTAKEDGYNPWKHGLLKCDSNGTGSKLTRAVQWSYILIGSCTEPVVVVTPRAKNWPRLSYGLLMMSLRTRTDGLTQSYDLQLRRVIQPKRWRLFHIVRTCMLIVHVKNRAKVRKSALERTARQTMTGRKR